MLVPFVQIRFAELNGSLKTVPLTSVQLIAPITKPNKILGIGLNYKDGADEMVSSSKSVAKTICEFQDNKMYPNNYNLGSINNKFY